MSTTEERRIGMGGMSLTDVLRGVSSSAMDLRRVRISAVVVCRLKLPLLGASVKFMCSLNAGGEKMAEEGATEPATNEPLRAVSVSIPAAGICRFCLKLWRLNFLRYSESKGWCESGIGGIGTLSIMVCLFSDLLSSSGLTNSDVEPALRESGPSDSSSSSMTASSMSSGWLARVAGSNIPSSSWYFLTRMRMTTVRTRIVPPIRYLGTQDKNKRYQNGRSGMAQKAPARVYPPEGLMKGKAAMTRGSPIMMTNRGSLYFSSPPCPGAAHLGFRICNDMWTTINRTLKSSETCQPYNLSMDAVEITCDFRAELDHESTCLTVRRVV